jgi:hypothetical protein
MGFFKKDDDELDPAEVAKLPTYEPDTPTAYDKYTKNPSPVEHVENGEWGGTERYDEQNKK